MKKDRPEKSDQKTKVTHDTIEMHRMLFDEASDGIFIADSQGRYIEVKGKTEKSINIQVDPAGQAMTPELKKENR